MLRKVTLVYTVCGPWMVSEGNAAEGGHRAGDGRRGQAQCRDKDGRGDGDDCEAGVGGVDPGPLTGVGDGGLELATPVWSCFNCTKTLYLKDFTEVWAGRLVSRCPIRVRRSESPRCRACTTD